MNGLTVEPYIPLALWLPLTLLAGGLWMAYVLASRRRLQGRVRPLVLALMLVALALPLAILLNPTWIEPIPPPAGKPYLTVATYPFPGAFAAIEAVAKGKAMKLSGGGLAVVDAGYPKSVHLAYPSVDYQVEVFDPSPARARKAVASGRVQAVR